MAREIQITPVRIQYAQKEELILFDTLLKLASEKQEEITRIIQRTLCDMKLNVDEVLREYRGEDGKISNFFLYKVHLQIVLSLLHNQQR